MRWPLRCLLALALLLAISSIALYLPRALNPSVEGPEKRARDRRWVNTSPYFLDRQACLWLSLCGVHHLRSDPPTRPQRLPDDVRLELRRRHVPLTAPPSWEQAAPPEQPEPAPPRRPSAHRLRTDDVPDYVLQHAPLVHLYSDEQFWPSDIGQHLDHMTAVVNKEPLNASHRWTLADLDHLNRHPGPVFLRSQDDVEARPSWLHSRTNVPTVFYDDDGKNAHPSPPPPPPPSAPAPGDSTSWFDVNKDRPLHRITDPRLRPHPERLVRRGHKPDAAGYSRAPAVLILVDKGSGILDAFWFFFYSYNLGQSVLGIRFGNHVGDWEHCMVRFENGIPRGIFFSEHEGGQAYAWHAVEKHNHRRPVLYSAVGSHAMYALPGQHAYILPFGLLKDLTDKGPLWDPALNKYAYFYQSAPDPAPPDSPDLLRSLVPAACNPDAPTSWFHFAGRWGDELYPLADPRQWRLFGQYHYVTGPNGPKFKQLDRSKLCQSPRCRILYELDPKGKWY